MPDKQTASHVTKNVQKLNPVELAYDSATSIPCMYPSEVKTGTGIGVHKSSF